VNAFPLPDLEFEGSRGFWEAAARGELALPRCGSCGTLCWYPPEVCPACGSALTWTSLSGRGRLFAWAVVRRPLVKEFAAWVPYVSGLVTLDEDPAVRIVTRIVDCEPEALRADMPLRAVFRRLSFPGVEGEVTAPCFAPAAEGSAETGRSR
jgi:uncharacterized OB-fold protein